MERLLEVRTLAVLWMEIILLLYYEEEGRVGEIQHVDIASVYTCQHHP